MLLVGRENFPDAFLPFSRKVKTGPRLSFLANSLPRRWFWCWSYRLPSCRRSDQETCGRRQRSETASTGGVPCMKCSFIRSLLIPSIRTIRNRGCRMPEPSRVSTPKMPFVTSKTSRELGTLFRTEPSRSRPRRSGACRRDAVEACSNATPWISEIQPTSARGLGV
jgi:hypothetical protein